MPKDVKASLTYEGKIVDMDDKAAAEKLVTEMVKNIMGGTKNLPEKILVTLDGKKVWRGLALDGSQAIEFACADKPELKDRKKELQFMADTGQSAEEIEQFARQLARDLAKASGREPVIKDASEFVGILPKVKTRKTRKDIGGKHQAQQVTEPAKKRNKGQFFVCSNPVRCQNKAELAKELEGLGNDAVTVIQGYERKFEIQHSLKEVK